MFTKILLAVAILVVALFGVGFGLCGAFGVIGGLASLTGPDAVLPLVLGIVGLGLAAVSVFLIEWLWSKLFR